MAIKACLNKIWKRLKVKSKPYNTVGLFSKLCTKKD